MKAADQFHVGIVVADLDAELDRLSTLLGYEWSDEVSVPTIVEFPSGRQEVHMRFRYSRDTPRLEVIQARPGTLWEPIGVSGLHHLGYWSDDIAADGAALEAAGYERQAQGFDDADNVTWAYYGPETGPRIELISRVLQPFLELLYAPA